MSKRITLQTYEIELIVSALKTLRDETNLSYEVIRIGKQEIDRIVDKIKEPEADTKGTDLATTDPDASKGLSNPPKETP